jgi:hypothetical protein
VRHDGVAVCVSLRDQEVVAVANAAAQSQLWQRLRR